MKIRLLKIAEAELDEAISYYNKELPGLGDQFLIEFLNGIERIKSFPEAWQPFSKKTKRYRLNKFPYGIIYQLLKNEI